MTTSGAPAAPPAAPGRAQPTPPSERVALLDVLRGFALLGILLVNMESFAVPIDEGWDAARFSGAADEISRWAILAFAALKFYTLFSLLFGYGLALQLQRAMARGDDARSRYARRLVGLIVLGLLHAVFLYFGDILIAYGVLGFVLLLLRDRPDRVVLNWALGVWLAGLAMVALLALASAAAGDSDLGRDISEVQAAYADGGFWDVVSQRLADLAIAIPSVVVLQAPTAFAMFALGLVLGRHRVLSRAREFRPQLLRGLAILAPIGVVGGALAASLDPLGDGGLSGLGLVLLFATAPALTFSYVAAIALVPERVLRAPAMWILRAPGRMSLSAYLLESVVATFTFTSLGLGLFGDVGPAAGLALSFVIWLGLALFSMLWLAVFRFGPFEWLLRSFSYRRLQPMSPRR
jgi:uncharacterized protein